MNHNYSFSEVGSSNEDETSIRNTVGELNQTAGKQAAFNASSINPNINHQIAALNDGQMRKNMTQ